MNVFVRVHNMFTRGSHEVHARFMRCSCKVHARFMRGSCEVHAMFMQGSCEVHMRFMRGSTNVDNILNLDNYITLINMGQTEDIKNDLYLHELSTKEIATKYDVGTSYINRLNRNILKNPPNDNKDVEKTQSPNFNKAIEGTSQVVTETITKSPNQWSTQTIMFYVGLILGFLLIAGLITFGMYKMYNYFFLNDNISLFEESINDIEKKAKEMIEKEYIDKINKMKEQHIKELKRSKYEYQEENEKLKQELENIKKICPSSSDSEV